MFARRGLASFLLAFSLCSLAWQSPVCAEVSSTAEVKEAPTEHPGIIFHQYYLGCLSQASYLIGDEKTKAAVVIDPQRDVDQYVADAKKNGLHITHVFLTHVHADFVAGHLELQRRTGAQICFSSKVKAGFKFAGFKDKDTLDLGNLRLETLETPGHTPESMSILVYDKEKDAAKPYAVLTGDCLFIGDVGRPDLLASQGVSARELAAMEYDSLRDKIMKLPDDTLVYPAHGAGSLCGKNMSKETVSSIGQEKKSNYALQPMTKEQLVTLLVENQPRAPMYFSYDAAFNRSKHDVLPNVLAKAMKPLSAEQAVRLKNSGAVILDGREPGEYATKHAIDTVNIPMRGRYATWAGAFIDHDKPIVLITDPGQEKQGAMRLGRIGLDHVVGFVDGGIKAFDEHPDLLAQNVRETPETLVKRMKSSNPPYVVDVRNDGEWNEASVAGTVHMPLMEILEHLDKLPKDKDLVIMCASGNRSSTATSLLAQKGVTRVTDLAGGIEAWMSEKLPVKTGAAVCKKTEAPAE